MALLAMMFEDQSLTCNLSSYLNVLVPCVMRLLSEKILAMEIKKQKSKNLKDMRK